MTPPTQANRGPLFWATAVVGWGLILLGIRGLSMNRNATPALGFARWFIGLAVVHDALLVPAVLLIAWTIGRIVPRRAVVPVRLGLATTGLLVLYAWPLVRGYGRRESNPSALPLDYGRNLVVSLLVIWLGVGIWITATSLHLHRRHRGPTGRTHE